MMDIKIVRGRGSIAMLIERGHSVRGIIRKKEQSDDLYNVGAIPVICDIEKTDDISEAIRDVDAVSLQLMQDRVAVLNVNRR